MNRLTKYFLIQFIISCSILFFYKNVLTQNVIIIDHLLNETGVLILDGPTCIRITMAPPGKKFITALDSGLYQVKIKYGSDPNSKFSKGQEFKIPNPKTPEETVLIVDKYLGGKNNFISISQEEYNQHNKIASSWPGEFYDVLSSFLLDNDFVSPYLHDSIKRRFREFQDFLVPLNYYHDLDIINLVQYDIASPKIDLIKLIYKLGPFMLDRGNKMNTGTLVDSYYKLAFKVNFYSSSNKLHSFGIAYWFYKNLPKGCDIFEEAKKHVNLNQ